MEKTKKRLKLGIKEETSWQTEGVDRQGRGERMKEREEIGEQETQAEKRGGGYVERRRRDQHWTGKAPAVQDLDIHTL